MRSAIGSCIGQRACVLHSARNLPQTIVVTVGQLACERRLARASAPVYGQKNLARATSGDAEDLA